jgi:hypothetical protein
METDAERYQSVFREGITIHARGVRRSAESIGRYVRLLVSTPPFETEAEEHLQDAELALTEALLAVKLARVEYANRPKVEASTRVNRGELSSVAAI